MKHKPPKSQKDVKKHAGKLLYLRYFCANRCNKFDFFWVKARKNNNKNKSEKKNKKKNDKTKGKCDSRKELLISETAHLLSNDFTNDNTNICKYKHEYVSFHEKCGNVSSVSLSQNDTALDFQMLGQSNHSIHLAPHVFFAFVFSLSLISLCVNLLCEHHGLHF